MRYKFIFIFVLLTIVILTSIKFISSKENHVKMKSRNASHLISPSYGTITGIRDQGDGYIRISIFLNLWDIHEQYSPCGGLIKDKKYKKGEFNGAYILEKSDKNERLDTLIISPLGLIGVSQIAGLIFKTIISDVSVGQHIEQGDTLGRIKFGSRVDLIIPSIGTRILSKVGDKVIGGNTVLAEWV